MARILGVDIFGSQLLIAELESRKSTAVKVLSLEMPHELTSANADRLGQWLRNCLSQNAITAKDAVCTLGRDRVTLKAIEVPVCPDNELAAIVAFEVEDNWNQPGIEPVIDFQAGPIGELGREVFVAMAAAPLITAINEMFSAAGLQCHHISLRPHATHFAWQSFANGQDGNILFLVPGQQTFELSIWQKDQLANCRSLRFNGKEDATSRVVSDIRRTIVSHHSHFPDAEVERVVVCAPNHYSMTESLRETLGIPVDRFDLSEQLEVTGGELSAGMVAAIGAGLMQFAKHSNWPVDLLNPKKPEVIRDRSKSMGIMVVLLVLMLPLAGYLYARNKLSQKDQEIAFYTEQLELLNNELKDLKPVLDRHKMISDWTEGGRNWLQELQELSNRLPDTSEMYLTRLNLSAGTATKPAIINVQGHTRTSKTYTERTTKLARDFSGHYTVHPGGLSPAGDSSEYAYRFSVDVEVNPFAAADVTTLSQEWEKKLESLKPAEGMRRVEVALRSETPAAKPSSTASTSPASSDSPTGSTAVAKVDSPDKPASSPSSNESDPADEADPDAKLRAMSYEQQQEYIKKLPTPFLKKAAEAKFKRLKESGQ